MEEIEVEGFKVNIEKDDGKFIVSVPMLPGCTVQVEKREDAPREIRRMIGLYLIELASKRPGVGGTQNPKKKDDKERGGKIKG